MAGGGNCIDGSLLSLVFRIFLVAGGVDEWKGEWNEQKILTTKEKTKYSSYVFCLHTTTLIARYLKWKVSNALLFKRIDLICFSTAIEYKDVWWKQG